MVQVHFILDIENLRDMTYLNEWKCNVAAYMDTKWVLDIVLGPFKRGGPTTKTMDYGKQLNCHWLLNILKCHVRVMTNYYLGLSMKYVAVPPHGPLSLSPGPTSLKSRFLFLMTWPLDDFQEPLNFHGHGSWSVCKPAHNAIVLVMPWMFKRPIYQP